MKKAYQITLLFFCCFGNSLFAQDTLYRKNNLYFGYKLSNEIYFFFTEGDSDEELPVHENNYHLSANVFYLKYLRQTNYEYELGLTSALSIGKVYNDFTHSYLNGVKGRAERERLSFSMMARINYPFIRKKVFDVYYGAGLGLRITKYSHYKANSIYAMDEDILKIFWPIALEGVGGFRYFPIKNIGLYIEAGFAKSFLQGGLLIAW